MRALLVAMLGVMLACGSSFAGNCGTGVQLVQTGHVQAVAVQQVVVAAPVIATVVVPQVQQVIVQQVHQWNFAQRVQFENV